MSSAGWDERTSAWSLWRCNSGTGELQMNTAGLHATCPPPDEDSLWASLGLLEQELQKSNKLWLKEIFGQCWDWRWIKGGLVQSLLPYPEFHGISTGKNWVLSCYLLPFGFAATGSSKTAWPGSSQLSLHLVRALPDTCSTKTENPHITSQAIFKLCWDFYPVSTNKTSFFNGIVSGLLWLGMGNLTWSLQPMTGR